MKRSSLAIVLALTACGPKVDPNRLHEVWLDAGNPVLHIETGRKVSVRSKSPESEYWVRLDDNGPHKAFFYAMGPSTLENPLLDVLLAYDRSNLTSQTVQIEIVWSADGLKSALLMDGVAEAIFDFEQKRGFCRSGEPGRISTWSPRGHQWDETAFRSFDELLNRESK